MNKNYQSLLNPLGRSTGNNFSFKGGLKTNSDRPDMGGVLHMISDQQKLHVFLSFFLQQEKKARTNELMYVFSIYFSQTIKTNKQPATTMMYNHVIHVLFLLEYSTNLEKKTTSVVSF